MDSQTYLLVYLAISVTLLAAARKWPNIVFWPLSLTHDQRYVGFSFEPAVYHLAIYSAISFGFYELHEVVSEAASTYLARQPSHEQNLHTLVEHLITYGVVFGIGGGLIFPFISLFATNWVMRGLEFFYHAELTHVHLHRLDDSLSGNFGQLSSTISEVRFIISRPRDELVLVVDTLNKALAALDETRPNSNARSISLVMTSDTKMLTQLFGIQATPFFLVAQRLWYEKYWKTEKSGYFLNLKDKSGNPITTPFESMFEESLTSCLAAMRTNFKQLLNVEPNSVNAQPCRVRAIRLVFGNAGELIDRARYLQPLLSAPILDPAESSSYPCNGILNIWINEQLAKKIRPKGWIPNPKERVLQHFTAPTTAWEGAMRELLSNLNLPTAHFFESVYDYEAGNYASDFLAIGGTIFKPGYAESGELRDEPDAALSGFLSRIPIVLMALNFRYVLPFDDLIAFFGSITDDERAAEYKKLLEGYPGSQIRASSRRTKAVASGTDTSSHQTVGKPFDLG